LIVVVIVIDDVVTDIVDVVIDDDVCSIVDVDDVLLLLLTVAYAPHVTRTLEITFTPHHYVRTLRRTLLFPSAYTCCCPAALAFFVDDDCFLRVLLVGLVHAVVIWLWLLTPLFVRDCSSSSVLVLVSWFVCIVVVEHCCCVIVDDAISSIVDR